MTIGCFTHEESIRSQKEANTKEFFKIFLETPVLRERQTIRAMRLIREGINVDAQHEILHSPLHACVRDNNLELVKELILFGADVNLENDFTDETVLYNAIYYGNQDIVKLLINAGADISVKNEQGLSTLQRILYAQPSLIQESLVFIINKVIDSEYWQFDSLRKELGEDFTSVETTDEMVANILRQDTPQSSIQTIEQLYHNATKMASQSLLTRLFDALKNSPVESGVASSSSQVCTDDEQPSITSYSLNTKRRRLV